MRSIAACLLRLYPAAWRRRYGAEFQALMEDVKPGWRTNFDLLKGAVRMQLSIPAFPKLALALSAVGLLLGLGFSFVVTPRYTSTATMVYQNGESITEFMRERAEVLSRVSVSALIQDPRVDLYREERQRLPLSDVIDLARQNIRIILLPAANQQATVFSVEYSYSDPVKTQAMDQALVSRFVESEWALKSAPKGRATGASGRIGKLEARIRALEQRLGMPPGDTDDPEFGSLIKVLDPPTLPSKPDYPDRTIFMAVGFGFGIALALVIAVFRRTIHPPASLPA